jgi:hypothetical protein
MFSVDEQKPSILTAFNDHFIEFVNDIINIFPNDKDILTAKNYFILIRKSNPKLIIKIWKKFISTKYEKEISSGDISFFIDKNYNDDLDGIENSDKIMEAINRLRNPVKLMDDENRQKTMKYIQNLSKISSLYNI